MTDVRLLTYNVRALKDDPLAVIRVIRGLNPDVACLQEVPRFLLWRLKRLRLAKAVGMSVAAGRRPAGLAVLAGPRARVVHREFHLLRYYPLLHRRALAIAVLEFGTEPGTGEGASRLITACTHLDLQSTARRAHTREVLDHLDRARETYRAPVVVAGDINEQPGGPSWALLAARFQDANAVAPTGEPLTFTSRHPRRRIDGIFADPAIDVRGCGVPTDPAIATDYPKATDHRPVLAELRF
ncbi:endonuclease/exonuclease/phosphatase family protein [Actinomadura sp. SCN-SB]|uniref:endonuclease/exonuclease/phosphatase family protein n=1 Tax=Actinomadura sp. SCN-SB TaxID=3373092 RepID=UPI0037536C42